MGDVIHEYTDATGRTVRVYKDGSVVVNYPDPPVKPSDVDEFHKNVLTLNLSVLTPTEMNEALTTMHDNAVAAIPYYEGMIANWATLTADQKDRLLYNLTRAMLQSIQYLTGKLT